MCCYQLHQGDFIPFSEKYERVTNYGMCPCCLEDIETVEHLFTKCENETITNLRNNIPGQIYAAINKHIQGSLPSWKLFYYYNKNKDISPTKEWDLSMGNLGFIPKEMQDYIENLLDEDTIFKTKYILCDISDAIMKINIEIWKYRCKLLYCGDNPP